MKFIKIILFISAITVSTLYAQTFNNVEKSKKYKLSVTDVPTDFEDEELDPEESALYNEGHDSEVLDEYDIPQLVDAKDNIPEVIDSKDKIPEVVDTDRKKDKDHNNNQAPQLRSDKSKVLKEDEAKY